MRREIRTTLLLGIAAFAIFGTGCVTEKVTPPPARPALTERDHIVQLQLFLDANHFGPGAVDGRVGEFLGKALARYDASHNLSRHTTPDVSAVVPYAEYKVTADDIARIGVIPADKADQAKQKSLPYTSLLELIAERFHTTKAFLAHLNPATNINAMGPGNLIKVPNVAQPFRIDTLPAAAKTPRDPNLSGKSVIVDINTKMLEISDHHHLIAAYPITPGSTEHPAPLGEWHIIGIATFPWFRYDEGVLQRGERTEDYYDLPPGPNSPVGILWMQLNRPSIGIHGTSTPETIGRSGSHGCIRLANWDAAVVRTMVTIDTPVTIR